MACGRNRDSSRIELKRLLLPHYQNAIIEKRMSIENTPLLWDAVPRVGTLGWYALPPSGQIER
jgi:hypothetical protein